MKHLVPKPEPNGERVAVDDLLADHQDLDQLLINPPNQTALIPMGDNPALDNPYHLTPTGFLIDLTAGDDVITKPLTNWTAKIISDIVLDDGL